MLLIIKQHVTPSFRTRLCLHIKSPHPQVRCGERGANTQTVIFPPRATLIISWPRSPILCRSGLFPPSTLIMRSDRLSMRCRSTTNKGRNAIRGKSWGGEEDQRFDSSPLVILGSDCDVLIIAFFPNYLCYWKIFLVFWMKSFIFGCWKWRWISLMEWQLVARLTVDSAKLKGAVMPFKATFHTELRPARFTPESSFQWVVNAPLYTLKGETEEILIGFGLVTARIIPVQSIFGRPVHRLTSLSAYVRWSSSLKIPTL